ncbi:hypothetical protein U9M48_041557 [Paspalum notatum var. saurae]|uniref:Uncharacterized protein n=1 Tax=Paspalum notatum var. saurae TaxID=547442 RepID=A0AAQ3UQT4_PASNO
METKHNQLPWITRGGGDDLVAANVNAKNILAFELILSLRRPVASGWGSCAHAYLVEDSIDDDGGGGLLLLLLRRAGALQAEHRVDRNILLFLRHHRHVKMERTVLLCRPEVVDAERAVSLPHSEVRRQGPGGKLELVGAPAFEGAEHSDEPDGAADAGGVGHADLRAIVGERDEAEHRFVGFRVAADDDAVVQIDPAEGARRPRHGEGGVDGEVVPVGRSGPRERLVREPDSLGHPREARCVGEPYVEHRMGEAAPLHAGQLGEEIGGRGRRLAAQSNGCIPDVVEAVPSVGRGWHRGEERPGRGGGGVQDDVASGRGRGRARAVVVATVEDDEVVGGAGDEALGAHLAAQAMGYGALELEGGDRRGRDELGATRDEEEDDVSLASFCCSDGRR